MLFFELIFFSWFLESLFTLLLPRAGFSRSRAPAGAYSAYLFALLYWRAKVIFAVSWLCLQRQETAF